MIKYNKAFDLAKENNIKLYKIITGSAYIAMNNNGHITTRTINKLCEAFQCQPGDLMEYILDKSE